MKEKGRKKRNHAIILLLIMLLASIPIHTTAEDVSWWNTHWSYRQQIHLPINTADNEAIHQPIDQKIIFDNPSWGTDELNHSIRICCFYNNQWEELESQIYSLKQSNKSSITQCRIIFLVPAFANGKEKYFVYYDEEQKPPTKYKDHVTVEESSYHYEPISGYPLESEFYKIIDNGKIPYMISQKGQFMGYDTSQHITKMLKGTTEVLPKHGELFASFDFKYYFGEGTYDYSSTSQHLISKQVFTDGNLMVSFAMKSQSKRKDLLSTVTYTYYHCPTDNTRIRVHVTHETRQEINLEKEISTDGIFAILQANEINSESIQDLNIGTLLPNLHLINEFNDLSVYPIDTNPEYIPEQPVIGLIEYNDDVDLGSNPWVSFNQGEQGKAHAIIFQTNNILQSGTNEKDGLQINAYEMDYPHLPGLENNIATVQIGRNSFEKETGHDCSIPHDFIAQFDAEFFSTATNGINAVQKEAGFFQQLINDVTTENNISSTTQKEEGKNKLSVIVHHAPSFPMGANFASLFGKQTSFIMVELYENNSLLSSETAVRLPTKEQHSQSITLKNIFKNMIRFFDWINISFFKKAVFDHVKPGEYIIKIFRENPFLTSERQFIGIAKIQLSNNEKIHVFCRPEKKIHCIIKDQYDLPVENATINLLQHKSIIFQEKTNEHGEVIVKAPANNNEYRLQVCYDGFVLSEEFIRLRTSHLFSYQRNFTLKRHDLKLRILDTWNLPPAVSLTPMILTETNEYIRSAEQKSSSLFLFPNLTKRSYNIYVKYKSFQLQQPVEITDDKEISISFPAQYNISLSVINNRGFFLDEFVVKLSRQNKAIRQKTTNGKLSISLPPGTYHAAVIHQGNIISKRNITIQSENNYEFISNQKSDLSFIVIIGIGLLGLLSSYLLYKKKDMKSVLILFSLFIIISSLVFPFWTMQGSVKTKETTTELYLIPTEMITTTISAHVIGGQRASLPDLFITFLNVLLTLIILSALSMGIYLFSYHSKIRKKQIFLFVALSLLLIVLVSFIIGLKLFSNVAIGSIIGQGSIQHSIPGETIAPSFACSWGPGIGFYLLLIATIVTAYHSVSQFLSKKERK